MTTEHYDPPTADELAAHEECRRRPEMVDKDMEERVELSFLAEKMREMLSRNIWIVSFELEAKKYEQSRAEFEVENLKVELSQKKKLAVSLGMLLCEDRFEMEEEEEDDYADGFWPQGLEE